MNNNLTKGLFFGFGIMLIVGGFVLFSNASWNETKVLNATNSAGKLTASDYNDLVDQIKGLRTNLNLLKNKACPDGFFDSHGECCRDNTILSCSGIKNGHFKPLGEVSRSATIRDVVRFIEDNTSNEYPISSADRAIGGYNIANYEQLSADNCKDTIQLKFNNSEDKYEWLRYSCYIGENHPSKNCEIFDSGDNKKSLCIVFRSDAFTYDQCGEGDLNTNSLSCSNGCKLGMYREFSCNTCYRGHIVDDDFTIPTEDICNTGLESGFYAVGGYNCKTYTVCEDGQTINEVNCLTGAVFNPGTALCQRKRITNIPVWAEQCDYPY